MKSKASPVLDVDYCCFKFQIQVKLSTDGTPLLVGAEMLARGKAKILTADGVNNYELPEHIPDFLKALRENPPLLRNWTQWTLEQASKALQATQHSSIHISLNVDPRQLLVDGFYADVESGIESSLRDRFTLELTESWPIPETEEVTRCLADIRDILAIDVSIDDFCTIPDENSDCPSYSNLDNTASPPRPHSHVYYLSNKPISEVKVDMSCAKLLIKERGTPTEKLILWITLLPDHFDNLRVVIEGISEYFPASFLSKFKGREKIWFQGYGFAEPKPIETLLAYISDPSSVKWHGTQQI